MRAIRYNLAYGGRHTITDEVAIRYACNKI